MNAPSEDLFYLMPDGDVCLMPRLMQPAPAAPTLDIPGAPLIPSACALCGDLVGPATWSDMPRGSWYCYSRSCPNHAGVLPGVKP